MRKLAISVHRSQRAAGLALALLCAAGLAGLGSPATPVWAAGKAALHTVVIQAVSYQPATLTVQRGDTVVWVNKDPFPHTVTAAGAFDSKSVAAGASWKYKAVKAGEYAYICTLHPNMTGTLKVE